jgi:hypothetical protein
MIWGFTFIPNLNYINYDNYYITGVDLNFPLNYIDRLVARIQVWDPSIINGTDRVNNLATIPYWLFISICSIIFLGNEPLTTAFIVSLGLFFAWLSFRYFANSILSYDGVVNKNSPFFQAILSFVALAYAFMPYNFYLLSRLNTHFFICIISPLLVGFLFNKNNDFSYLSKNEKIAITSISIFLFPLFAIQPPLLMTLFFVILIQFILQFRISAFKISKATIFFIWKIVLLQMWWFLPWFVYLLNGNFFDSIEFKKSFNVSSLISYSSNCSNIPGVITGLADTEWCQDSEAPFWTTPSALSNSFLFYFIFLVNILSILYYSFSIRNKSKIIVLITSGMFFFLSLGANLPFGPINLYILDNIPFMSMYRAPWMKLSFPFYLYAYWIYFCVIIHILRYGTESYQK